MTSTWTCGIGSNVQLVENDIRDQEVQLPSKAKSRGLGVAFNFGGEQAEADPLLQEAFYESDAYQLCESREDPHCFLIARTGSGKSALLQRLEETRSSHVIRINPEDLSLPYITDLGVIRYLDSIDVNLDPLFIALWKHILLVEVIRHRYKVDSPDAKPYACRSNSVGRPEEGRA